MSNRGYYRPNHRTDNVDRLDILAGTGKMLLCLFAKLKLLVYVVSLSMVLNSAHIQWSSVSVINGLGIFHPFVPTVWLSPVCIINLRLELRS